MKRVDFQPEFNSLQTLVLLINDLKVISNLSASKGQRAE